MEWRDEGIILGVRRHGETSAILEAMTREHGRPSGLVRGGRSRKLQPVLQPGNRVELLWRARLDEHLGTFQAEPLEMHAARLMGSAAGVFGLQTLAAHLRLLPERDPHEHLFEMLAMVLEHLEDPHAAGELVVRFELLVLEELGFGLDLSQCAVTGMRAGTGLCLAEIRPRGVAPGRPCLARQDAGAAGLSAEGSGVARRPAGARERVSADRLLLCAARL